MICSPRIDYILTWFSNVDSLIDNELDEILDQLYLKIKQFLHIKVGEDIDQDLIDISLETTENGELIINPEFDYAVEPEFSEGLASIKKNGKQVFIDTKGKVIIKTDAWSASNFSEGLANLTYK